MILKVEHIAKSYGKKKVLTDVSFEVHQGQMTGIVGENGSGKSTLMKIIVGELKANKGKILSRGKYTRPWNLLRIKTCNIILLCRKMIIGL